MLRHSDDVLKRNACRNLLEAAETTGSDIVSGLCARRHLDSRHQSTTEWYPWLYASTRTVDSVTELPGLFVWDTLSTNKCYRHHFLADRQLRFPKGKFYENLQFIAEAYPATRRVTLVPNQVHFWPTRRQRPSRSPTAATR